LRPSTEVTLSAWFRSASGDGLGDEEVLTIGDNVNIRVRPTSMEIAKRTSTGHKQCWVWIQGNPYDNKWHHLAGVVTNSEIRVYFDGVSSDPCPTSAPIYYPYSPVDIWVGRHGLGTSDLRDYEGGVDEVRIYMRALSAAEISRLASGK
jgi:hypothetical protein